MKLRVKFVLIFLPINILFATVLLLVVSYLISLGFAEIEHETLDRRVIRARYLLEKRIEQIDVSARDWSSWDTAYDFVQNKNARFITDNMSPDAFKILGVNVAAYFDKSGKLLSAVAVDLKTGEEVPLPQELLNYFDSLKLTPPYSGVLSTETTEPILFSYKPVVKSNGSGTPQGSLLFMRYIDAEILDYFTSISMFKVGVYTSEELPALNRVVSSEVLISNASSTQATAYVAFPAVGADNKIFISIESPREGNIQASFVLKWVLGVVVLMLVLMLTTLFIVMDRVVLKRLSLLAKLVQKAVSTGRYEKEDIISGNDEISALSRIAYENFKYLVASAERAEMSEKQLQYTVDSMNEVVFMVTSTGIFQNFHKKIGGSQTIAYELHKGFIGKHVSQLPLSEDLISDFAHAIEDVKKTKQSISLEYPLSNNSTTLWFRANLSPRPSALAEYAGITFVSRDITEQKVSQLALEEKSKELEKINSFMIGREDKMSELKQENALLKGILKEHNISYTLELPKEL